MILVKVSQGNSSEVSEIFSHVLFSILTETPQVKLLTEQSTQFLHPCPLFQFYSGQKIKSSKWLSFLSVKKQQVLQVKLCKTKSATNMGLSPCQL